MENVLMGIIRSEHPIKLKKGLIKKIVDANSSHDKRLDIKLFMNSIEMYLIDLNHEQSHLDIDEYTQNLFDVIKYSIDYLLNTVEYDTDDYYNYYLCEDNLANLISKHKNTLNLIIWLRVNIELLIDKKHLTYDLMKIMITSLNSHLKTTNQLNKNIQLFVNYLKFVDLFLPILKKLTNINENYDINSPHLTLLHSIIHLIIKFMAKYKFNDDKFNNQYDLKVFMSILDKIIEILHQLLSSNCYNQLFKLFMTDLIELLIETDDAESGGNVESTCELNVYMAHVFKHININDAYEFIKEFLMKKAAYLFKTKEQEDKAIKSILYNFIHFLSWPFYQSMDVWTIGFMKLIAHMNKYIILIECCEQKSSFLLDLMHQNQARKSSLNVFSFFLVNYQHSPKLFHDCCTRITKLIELFKSENDIENYKHLSLLSYTCMNMFGGYPQIYSPILELIQNDLNYDSFNKDLDDLKSKYSLNITVSLTNEAIESSTSNDYYLQVEKLREHSTGFVNLGNTCYLNCIMQSLYACKIFVRQLFEIDTSAVRMDEKSLFILQNQSLFAYMYLTRRPSIKPQEFVKLCTPEWFQFGHQQDSSEFLMYLMDNLNEQFKQFKRVNPIQSLFGCKLSTECVCFNCKTKTIRNDTSFIIPLSFPHQQTDTDKLNVQQLIDKFFQEEELSEREDNLYSCTKCNSLQVAHKTHKFIRNSSLTSNPLPEYLVFTLNRFQYETNKETKEIRNRKIMTKLEYNRVISLSTFNENDNDSECAIIEHYVLIAIVVHSGSSLHHGHYYSYINEMNEVDDGQFGLLLRQQQQQPGASSSTISPYWLLMNDEQVSRITNETFTSNQNTFKNDTPYVLFYKRVSSSQQAAAATTKQSFEIKNKRLIDQINTDSNKYLIECEQAIAKRKQKSQSKNSQKSSNLNNIFYSNNYKDDDGSNDGEPPSYCNNNSHIDNGPRFVY